MHRAIRMGDIGEVRNYIAGPDGHKLAIAKNYYGENLL